MKKALLVIDVQNGIVNFKDFTQELELIEHTIKDFKEANNPVIFVQHFDKQDENPLHRDLEGSNIYPKLKVYADYVVEKDSPSAFFKTNLSSLLNDLGVEQLFITGFNTEFCCMYTAISAYDRGYKVTFIENATGSVNEGETYEMQDLDIRDFVGTVLHWSGAIEVLDFEEYKEVYQIVKGK
ncbi:cysteine hydrolase family protein [Paucisalibacillus sp. EB02]|uniref:cysteine hydrolase family protein n=1 Tax=Paucisalibacillus sp. EB02 TaxID=1347087 RepID=UPI0005A8322E|nr:isochorismatase family cysteine hydrolase [Paucisalibacillus sp. EB02]